MTGLIRAFVWLRWRLLVNSLRGGRRRDALERVSRAAAVIVPLVLGVMLIPLALGLAAAAAFAGFKMGRAGAPHPIFLLSARGLLGILTAAIVLTPIVRSVQSAGTGSERFTLLPIPRRLLHALEMMVGLADPWIAILVLPLLALPAGLLAAGAPGAATVAFIGGVLFLGALLGLASLLSSALQWVYRSRKRGEVVTLVVLIGLSLMGFLPMLLGDMVEHRARDGKARRHAQERQSSPPPAGASHDAGDRTGSGEDGEKQDEEAASAKKPAGGETGEKPSEGDASAQVPGGAVVDSSNPASGASGQESPADTATSSSGDRERPAEVVRAAREGDPWALAPWKVRVFGRALPSELYVWSLSAAIQGRAGRALGALGGLAFAAGLLYTLSWTTYRRILETPPSGASGHGVRELKIVTPRVPGLGPAASAVAYAQLRSTLRTVQGKMILFFSPAAVTLAFIVFTRNPGGRLATYGIGKGGVAVLWVGTAMVMLSLQKMILNQFAIDRAGFTMQLLSPLSASDIIKGKAAGIGALSSLLFSYFMIFAAITSRSGPQLTWVPPILGAVSVYLVYAPIAATLSALFPRAADLNRMGSGGNPSGLATFLGLLFLGVAVSPPALLSLGALLVGKSPWLAIGLAVLWTAVAIPLSFLLMRLAVRTLEARLENVALVAQGR